MNAREVRACLVVLMFALLATVHVQLFAVFYVSTETTGKSSLPVCIIMYCRPTVHFILHYILPVQFLGSHSCSKCLCPEFVMDYYSTPSSGEEYFGLSGHVRISPNVSKFSMLSVLHIAIRHIIRILWMT